MVYEKVGTEQIVLLIIGMVIFIVAPIIMAIVWKVKKKEPFTTILIGAATFFVFVMIEKPIQNVLLFPTAMGLPEHSVSRFINAAPILLSFLAGLFPGLFEETGRFVAYKTLLKNRKNRETSISHGIGHGGFEVIFILGATFLNYIIYAVMINSGTFGTVVDTVAKQGMKEQVDQINDIASMLAGFSVNDLALNIFERIVAVLFHIGGSILVFYACKDRKKIWLYPLAILLHTLMDGALALSMFKVITLSNWQLEMIFAIFSLLVFFGAYFMLYRKDTDTRESMLAVKEAENTGDNMLEAKEDVNAKEA
ncbi:MAG: YhfC family intramembrane metalloprotease [Lachnospiraceae bacterium]|nr:YhfC family intramembrane metalloprotease [Lachnospiraceae bacterium]